jgi:hypothetical protein
VPLELELPLLFDELPLLELEPEDREAGIAADATSTELQAWRGTPPSQRSVDKGRRMGNRDWGRAQAAQGQLGRGRWHPDVAPGRHKLAAPQSSSGRAEMDQLSTESLQTAPRVNDGCDEALGGNLGSSVQRCTGCEKQLISTAVNCPRLPRCQTRKLSRQTTTMLAHVATQTGCRASQTAETTFRIGSSTPRRLPRQCSTAAAAAARVDRPGLVAVPITFSCGGGDEVTVDALPGQNLWEVRRCGSC